MISIRTTLAAAAVFAAGSAIAQESTNRVAEHRDWSVFVESSPKECWGVTAPQSVSNTRGGQEVEVTRGDILLFVFYRPAAGVSGQVTFTGGYPFAGGSDVEVDIDGQKFSMFTEGQWAWPKSSEDDAKIIAAMKAGSNAVLSARSARGTNTKDTFSLLGFTNALDDAAGRCG